MTIRMVAVAALLAGTIGGQALASNGERPENPELAKVIARGVEHRPVTDAADAEAYAARITAATYGKPEAEAQSPFRAVPDGDRWRVTGSRPMNLAALSGPLTIVVRRDDGSIRDIVFTAAPAGWDAHLRPPGSSSVR